MAAEYMHIGIPVLNKKEGMTYNEDMKFWVSNVDDYDFKIEYLKFEEGTPSRRFFPSSPMWLTGWTIWTTMPPRLRGSYSGRLTAALACAWHL